jgi:hypothetical protein
VQKSTEKGTDKGKGVVKIRSVAVVNAVQTPAVHEQIELQEDCHAPAKLSSKAARAPKILPSAGPIRKTHELLGLRVNNHIN